MEGAIYFEINIAKDCKGFKVGVTKTIDFDVQKSFCEFDTGYAFFSKGQLRHNSDSMGEFIKLFFRFLTILGVKYGHSCKEKEAHKIGVFLNVTRGEIGFSINGTFHKIAFSSEDLKSGPLYPAVALREGGSANFGKVVRNTDDLVMN